jgi:serine/threonine protein phosphatase PrpC
VAVGGIVLVTDRGLHHTRNEDAAAAGVVPTDDGRFAFAVAVCDGVSTSADAQAAATAAAQAGVAAMLDALAACRSGHGAAATGLADAARAAARTAAGGIDPASAPACTYTAAAVVPAAPNAVHITVANVGDSRVYWLPDPPGRAQQLTVDDSVAQELIGAGLSAQSTAVRAGAHTLTRWLGADAETDAEPWTDTSVRTIAATGAGLLVICTDGLWNYLPEPGDIARVCVGGDAHTVARRLVDYALQAGGQDNVTVAVIPIGDRHESR